MTKTTLFHNPSCSKCTKTLRLLEERGIEVEIISYLEEPPSVSVLDHVCRALGVEPDALIRTGEARYAELGLGDERPRSRGEWLRILAENPVLLQRPIVIHDGRAVIARLPQHVLRILG